MSDNLGTTYITGLLCFPATNKYIQKNHSGFHFNGNVWRGLTGLKSAISGLEFLFRMCW
jgi:hypothetical protein